MKFKSLVEARAHQRAISQMVTRAYDEIGAEMTETPLSDQEVNWDGLTMFGDANDTETRMMKLSSIVEQLKEAGEEVSRLAELSNISIGAGGIEVVSDQMGAEPFHTRMARAFIAAGAPIGSRIVMDTDELGAVLQQRALFNTGSFDPDLTRQSRIQLPVSRRLTMLDAVTVQPTGKDGVSYTRVTTDASASTNTAEGAALAENEIDTTDAIAPVRNIGSQMPVTDQVLADEEQTGELIRRLLVRDARRRLENQIYNGTGSGQQIQGFSTTTGIQGAYDGTTESSAAIAYEKGAAEYEDEYQMEPGIAVMSATTWGLYAASATTTGALAGPREAITDGIRRMAWGTPVITNSLVDDGDIWVLNPEDLVLYDRKQAAVEVGYSADDFIKMQMRLRCYLRAALVLWEPDSVKKIMVPTS